MIMLLLREEGGMKNKFIYIQMLVIKMIARLPNCGNTLRAYNTTLFWKHYKGTQLIAGSNGKKL